VFPALAEVCPPMDSLAAVLLRRTGQLHLPVSAEPPGHPGFADHLEIDLAERGWVMDPVARAAFEAMPEPARTAWADWLLATVEAEVGADVPHVPLFRRFPDTTPADTVGLLVERVIAYLLQVPDQPCVLCGTEGRVRPVRPCGHLVCAACFDGADYSGCPICHRRIDPDDPFLAVAPVRFTPFPGVPLRLRRVAGRPVELRPLAAAALRDQLVTRVMPLSEAERADLAVLCGATTDPGDLAWLPAEVPARETMAVVGAMALAAAPPERLAATVAAVAGRWTTATDVARTLWVRSGGSPALLVPRRPDPVARAGPERRLAPARRTQGQLAPGQGRARAAGHAPGRARRLRAL
jgi:hypothetical protein